VTEPDFTAQLRKFASEDYFPNNLYDLIASWDASGVGFEAVEPILRFIEDNPELDFGVPGPLVTFVERFQGRGYEEELLKSLHRKPTDHTTWMLNRLINGAKSASERQKYVDAMQLAREHPQADEMALLSIDQFLARLAAYKWTARRL
jgi:hypothetical protein